MHDNMKQPLVFDIKRATTSDGFGLRTAVFFKGCNLNCYWCHNPEGKSHEAQIAFFREKCIGCNACRQLCSKNADACVACGACTEVCPTSALRLYGKSYTPSELLEILIADIRYYQATGGGVTFSGGECMLYPEYIAEVARLCCENGISVDIDTAGCVPYESFETVLPYTDCFLYDIKCLDAELHRMGTGKDNILILENLERLQLTGKQIIIRVPVIDGFNAGEELEKIKAYCSLRKLPIELLPYHSFGIDKEKSLLR